MNPGNLIPVPDTNPVHWAWFQVLYGHFIYTSSILMAVYWLSIILRLIIAYYAAYIYDFKFNQMGRSRTIFISISVILLLWIGFVFTNNILQALFWTVKRPSILTEKAVRSGLNWFAWATCIQFVVGVWFLISLPEDSWHILNPAPLLLRCRLILAHPGSMNRTVSTVMYTLAGRMRRRQTGLISGPKDFLNFTGSGMTIPAV